MATVLAQEVVDAQGARCEELPLVVPEEEVPPDMDVQDQRRDLDPLESSGHFRCDAQADQ